MPDPINAKSIFLAAIEIESEQKRGEFVEEQCAGNAALAAEVNKLLDNQPRGSYLESPVRPALLATQDLMQPGSPHREIVHTQIGPYKIREMIGEGGMGCVFVAEQERPLRRKVALKLIKPGMDSKAVLGRFEAERNALALMNHPHIAKVLDAGTSDEGHPFFVMELVNGIPITEYCDEQKLSVRDRLQLFVDVCSAIQHAHQKGIIHRDIKPSNVLVTELDGKPIAKVIDFGVAKALNQSLTEHSVYTAFQTVVGTPLYMSPEQASFSAVDVDTRSDVYSLGVLLYELLTGTTPFTQDDLKQAAQDEVFKLIREQEPPRPSNRISSLGQTATRISQLRRSQPQQLTRSVQGDLDWIVMKALSKERSRRYDSATRLAEDVDRHLKSEVVEARPPSFLYQMRKFYRRNRQLATGVLLGFSMLLFGLGLAINFGIQAFEEKGKSENALYTLGDASVRLALDHALSSNLQGMERALDVANTAGVSEHRQELIRLCSKLYSSDDKNYPDLVKDVESLVDKAQTKKEEIAAKALLANAAIWSGNHLDLHYKKLLELHDELPMILDQTQELDLEGRVFLGQAIGPVIPEDGLQLLEPAYQQTQSPAIRLILAQVKLELVRDTPAPELARQAYEDANAAYLFLPQSSMASALRAVALHTAWRHNLDGIKHWYLDEAWRMMDETETGAIHPGGIFAADFLGEADLSNSVTLFWNMLENGRLMPNVPGYLIAHSPERYEEILDVLEARIDRGDDLAWGGIPNSVLLLKAMDKSKHAELTQALTSIDGSQRRIIGADPRFFGLFAGLIVEGRSGANVRRLAESFKRYPPIQQIYFANDISEYILGETSESKFIELNRYSPRRLALAQTLVAFAKIGARDRQAAIAHLEKVMDIPTTYTFRGFVSAFNRLLSENHELVKWVPRND